MKNTIKFKTKEGDLEMTKDAFIRWMCLVELILLTEEKAEELKLDLDKFDWVKPIAFKKYINDRFKSMEVDIEAEANSKKPLLKPMDKLAMINNIHHIPEYR
jgi:hypothetical protein